MVYYKFIKKFPSSDRVKATTKALTQYKYSVINVTEEELIIMMVKTISEEKLEDYPYLLPEQREKTLKHCIELVEESMMDRVNQKMRKRLPSGWIKDIYYESKFPENLSSEDITYLYKKIRAFYYSIHTI